MSIPNPGDGRVTTLRHYAKNWTLSLAMKICHGEGKWLLRQMLYRHVPQAIMDRPKMGFGVPIDVWLRGPLKAWAADLIEPGRLAREGLFDPVPIQRNGSSISPAAVTGRITCGTC